MSFQKFARFKLHRRELQRKDFFRRWQRFLITQELRQKRKQVDRHRNNLLRIYDIVKNVMSFIDFNHVLHYIHKNVDNYKKQVSVVHARKLYNLGAFYKPPSLNPDDVITNLSDRSFSTREKWLLSFGLDHCFTPKFPKLRFGLCLESLFCNLLNHPFANNLNQNDLVLDLRTLMSNTLDFYKHSEKEGTTLFKDSDLKILKT